MIITIRAKVQNVVSKYLCVQLSKCNFCGLRTPAPDAGIIVPEDSGFNK